MADVRGIHLAPCLFLFVVLLLSTGPVPRSYSEAISVIHLTLVVSTSSDWTTLTFYNLTLLNTSNRITSGQDAPQLSYSISPSAVYIGKRQYDETNVTMEIEGLVQPKGDQVNLLIEKGAIGDTILRIFYEGRELAAFSSRGSVPGHEDTNARAFDLTGLFSDLKSDMMEINLGRILKRPLVLSFYYPWYGNALGKSGEQYHWSDVTYQGIGSSTYYPLFGPYDSQDERLIGAHMELAKASGIDGFICSWWGIDTFEDRALKEILKVADSEGFNVTIYYETVRDMGRDQIVNELAYVIESYSNEPSFLKIDGRPVIFLYAISAYDRDVGFWQDVAEGVRESTKADPLFMADAFDLSYAAAFDGFHTYNPIWIKGEDLNRSYSDQANAVRAAGKIWAATVCPGYDDRKIRSPGDYVDRGGGVYYNLTWESAIRSDPDIVLVCTWNEWHEGTTIEPGREYEFKYLTLTRYWAAKYKDVNLSRPSGERPSLDLNLTATNGELRVLVHNRGDDDAFGTNLLVSSEGISYSGVSNAIYLPINRSSIVLFIPMLTANETYDIGIPPSGFGGTAPSAYGFYYSSWGERSLIPLAGTESNAQYYLTVDSPYGDASGSGWYPGDSIAYAGLASDVANVTPGTRQLFVGWSGDASGGNYLRSDPIVMNGPKNAVANWTTQYMLTIESEHGSPAGGGWQNAGSYATISIEGSAPEFGGLIYHYFKEWEGVGIADPSLSTTTIMMEGPKNVRAIWTTDYASLTTLIGVAISGIIIAAICWMRRSAKRRT